MSSSVPSYTFDQVYHFNSDITDKLEFEFELDQTFMNIDTDYKTIGLREIRVIPESFPLKFVIYYEKKSKLAKDPIDPTYKSDGMTIDDPGDPGNDAEYSELGEEIEIQVTAANNFEEIIDNIISTFNGKLASTYLKYEYNAKTHHLRIWCDKTDDNDYFGIKQYYFKIYRLIYKQEVFQNIFHLLNIPLDRKDLLPDQWYPEINFDNIWDRRNLYIHSSIANTTPYNYLGHDNEFYQTPSKLYKWTSKSKTCRIWISFDGQTPVKLYHQPFLIQFQLIASCYR
jgi:hypothetical protein